MGERIKEAREDRGWSQKDLASKAGVSQGAIGNLEIGLRQTSRKLLEIAAALQVRPEWLATGRGEKAAEGVPFSALRKPSADFQNHYEVSENDWCLLQAVKTVLSERELEDIQRRAAEVEKRVQERLEALKGHLKD